MSGGDSKHRTIRVSNLPDKIHKDKLKIHFQRRKNGGGEITEVKTIPESREALVVFEDKTVAENVLTKEHILEGVTVRVEKYKEEIPKGNRVLVSNLPEDITKNDIHIHFQRKKNMGGEVKEVKLLSRGRAVVVFEDHKVASAVAAREQIIKGKLVKVKITENDEQGTSATLDSDLSEDSVLDKAIEEKMQTRRAPVDTRHSLNSEKEQPNISARERNDNSSLRGRQEMPLPKETEVTKERVHTQHMPTRKDSCESPTTTKKEAEELLPMFKEKEYLGKTILVSDIPDGVSETDVLLFFQKRSNAGGEVEQAKLFPEQKKALVVFVDAEVAENVLLKEHTLKGNHVRVEKYSPQPKIIKVDCVFAIVTATINPSLLQKIEPALYKSILDETEVNTGIQWHHSAYGLLVTGSFEQVKKANDVLKLQFSKVCSQQSNAERPQSWNEVYMESGDKSSEYHGGSSMMYPSSMYPQLSQRFANIPSNFPEGNSSHINMEEPSFNVMAETNIQDKQSWKRDNTWEADRDGNQSSHRVFGKKHDDSVGSLFNVRKMSGGTHANAQDMVKHPPETGDRESNSSPFQSPRGTETGTRESNSSPFQSPRGTETGAREIKPSAFQSPRGTETGARESNPSPFQSPRGTETGARESNPSPFQSPRGSETGASESNSILFQFPRENTARNDSPARELKTPADFQQSGKPSSAQSGHASWSTSDQNNVSVKTAALFEESSHENKKKISSRHPSQAERRPNAANFPPVSKNHSRQVEDSSLVTPNTASLSLGHGCENPQGSFEQPSVATVEDKGTHDGSSVQRSSNNIDNSDESKSDSPIPKNEPCADSLEVIENAFQEMRLDEETSSIGVAKFIQQVYRDDLETFKSRYGVDVVLSKDQKRFTLKPMQQGVTQSELSEAEGKLQQFFEATSGKLTAVTIDLRKFTAEDTEKIRESMLRQRSQFDVMFEESNRGVYSLVGSVENVEMFRRNVIGALQKNAPVTKEMAPTEPTVASRKGVRVILMLGDLEKQVCDAIVNFTDRDLVHKTGIASAIKQAAGMAFWTECRDIIAKNGSLVSNMVTITTGGTSPCQHVIHAILPDLSKERRQEALRHGLQETCRRVLRTAKEKQLKSICFPVVTPDMVNLPVVVSSRLLFHVITTFIEENSPLNNNTIEEIRIVYRKNSRVAEEFANEFSKTFNSE